MENTSGGDDELPVHNSNGAEAGALSQFELEIQAACEDIYAQFLAKAKQPQTEEVAEDHSGLVCTTEFQGNIEKIASDIFAKFQAKVEQPRMEEAAEYHSTITYSRAQIQVAKDGESDPQSSTSEVELMGNPEQVNNADQLVKDVIAENRTSRGPFGSYNQQHGGGYGPFGPQQGGPTAATPPYGYQQPPHYPGPPQQYQQPPSQAHGEFSQQPASGYSSGWEHRSLASAAQTQQQTSFDCYWQQSQQVHQTSQGIAAPTEASGYGYNVQSYYQQPAQTPSYGDPPPTHGQPSYPQQAYAQPVCSGYFYAQPAQGDQQVLGQQGYADYGQPQTGYAATTGDGPAPASGFC